MKSLDKIATTFQNDPEADRQVLINQINEIKQKYNIKSWPTDEPILDLKINMDQVDLAEFENRKTYINQILEQLMSDKYAEKRLEILNKVSKRKLIN